MAWTRFPVPEYDHRALKGLAYADPSLIPADRAEAIAEAARGGDASVAGAYFVTPDPGLLARLSFAGEYHHMVLCALPPGGCHLLARSYAWFNQRAFILSDNAEDAEILHSWRTPRPNNTRLGPDDGVELDTPVIYILSGRILEDEIRGNRLIVENDWSPGDGREGFRILAGCDKGGDEFNNSCFMVSWTG